MSTALRWTSADLEALPDDGKRYEIIEGELYMSRSPHWHHQVASGNLHAHLWNWNKTANAGVVTSTPGVIFTDDDDVIPDVVWISHERLSTALHEDGRLHAAPDLAVEVLSFGTINEKRDREAKLKLYSKRGVLEYWIADWRARTIEVYRRQDAALQLVATLYTNDLLTSPLLTGFSVKVKDIFENIA